MNCKRCGAPITAGDLFCKGCGATIEKEETIQSTNVGEQSPFGPVMPQSAPVEMASPSVNPQPSMPSMMTNPSTVASMPNVNSQPQKKGNGILIVILAIIVLAIAGGAFYFGTTWNKEEDKEDTPIQETVETYKVYYSDFTFDVPTEYLYEIDEDGLTIYDKNNTVAFFVYIKEGDFDKAVANRSTFKEDCKQGGMACSELELETIDGKDYLVSEIEQAGTKYIVAFTKLTSKYNMLSMLIDSSNEYNHSLLTEINNIVKTATYVGSSTNAKIEMNIDLDSLLGE